MNRTKIRDALDSIEAAPGVQETLYRDIVSRARDKEYMSKQRLRFFKMKLDRAMPWVAACVVLLFGFCLYGVTSGLFTGAPYVSDKQLAGMIEETAGSAVPEVNTEGGAGAGTPDAGAPEPQAEAAPEAAYGGERATADTVETRESVTAYAAIDVGFTAYTISGVPADAFLFWDELARLHAVPKGIALLGYHLEETSLTLNFSDDLQALLDASATSYFVTALAKSFYGLYPELTALTLQSGGKPISFQGAEIDATPLLYEELSVTDTKTLAYGEEIPQI